MQGTQNKVGESNIVQLPFAHSPMQCGCGKAYYPSQAWIHDGRNPDCMVANAVEMVDNTPRLLVANSKHGKYRDIDKRRDYMRSYMAKRRSSTGSR